MQALLVCADVQFLGITRSVLSRLRVTPQVERTTEAALRVIQERELDVVVVDWREIDSVADFLGAVRRSELNRSCVLVAIVRDLLDLKQAFAAGVHFLIHKPASEVQIERCLRAAYCARVAERRKRHREAVEIVASLTTRTRPFGEAVVVNLSEGGARLRTDDLSLSASEEVDLRFALPETGEMLDVDGIVVWAGDRECGVKFQYLAEGQRASLEQWLTECVERSLRASCARLREECA
jgi:FixJ family two-component response regulator